MKTVFFALLLSTALGASAQTAPEPVFQLNCQDGGWKSYKQDKNFCETRDLAFDAPAGQPLVVNAEPNGGIAVHGWDGPNIRVRVKVQSWDLSEEVARSRAKSVVVGLVNGTLRATSPNGLDKWSVSYEIFAPRQTGLALSTINGGISLDNLNAAIRFTTVNGGVKLTNLAGHVQGQTVNGGLDIALSGEKWNGQGLDVTTTNGGIDWTLPAGYSAQLFTSTDMGGIRTGLPVTKSGLFHKEVVANLGQGGPALRAVTTNGGIRVQQGRE